MNNLQKRILTSLVALPLSFFFIVKGGYFLLFFLLAIFFAANYELFSIFKRKGIILFLDLSLILSLYSIYYLREYTTHLFYILLWVISLCILSDIGGYAFGKIFKWKKLTTISPNKTLSGVLGSFIFSLLSVFIAGTIEADFFELDFFILALVFSLVAQAGDLLISYFKRLEKIKDTGKILPGHGGIFDRVDGLMFVVILTFVLHQFNVLP